MCIYICMYVYVYIHTYVCIYTSFLLGATPSDRAPNALRRISGVYYSCKDIYVYVCMCTYIG